MGWPDINSFQCVAGAWLCSCTLTTFITFIKCHKKNEYIKTRTQRRTFSFSSMSLDFFFYRPLHSNSSDPKYCFVSLLPGSAVKHLSCWSSTRSISSLIYDSLKKITDKDKRMMRGKKAARNLKTGAGRLSLFLQEDHVLVGIMRHSCPKQSAHRHIFRRSCLIYL